MCHETSLPADVVLSFVCFAVSTVTELPITVTAIRAVHRNWNVYVFKVAARLFFTLPYNLQLVSDRIQYVPPWTRVNGIITMADREMGARMMEPHDADFILIVTAQLLLQHFLTQRRRPVDFTLGEVIDLFVNVVVGVLDAMHPFIQEGFMQTLDMYGPYEDFREINIWWQIHRMHRCWREAPSGHFCLAALLETLIKCHLWRVEEVSRMI